MPENKSPPLSLTYQVYSDLGEINPYSVKTEEDEENYYKSLLWVVRIATW